MRLQLPRLQPLVAFLAASLLFALVFAAPPPNFHEETATSGIHHAYRGGREYLVGGGVAVFDCNQDGYPDIFLAGGAAPAALYRNDSLKGGPLNFQVIPASGLELERVIGAYPLDIDGDDLTDLAVLRVGENLLLRGLGSCRFEVANESWGFSGGHEWSTALAARWEPGHHWPTLAIGNYIDLDEPGAPFGTCQDNLLYRPADNDHGFARPTVLTPSYCALSMLFSDWNRSGEPSLRISNDRQYYLTSEDRSGGEQLWHFSTAGDPIPYRAEDGWRKLQIWGMGIASADITGDVYPEYFLSSMADNKLRTLVSGATGPSYQDIAFQRGVTAHRPFTGDNQHPSTAWHAVFEDVDNDGFYDLFIAKGNVEAMPDFALEDPNNLLMGAADGSFTEVADKANLLSFKRARGAAVVDLNLDGLPDVVVSNREDEAQLWRNLGSGTVEHPEPLGNWLAVQPKQPGGNRDAIGAWLEVRVGSRTIRREVTVGGGHAGGTLAWLHIGLGEAETALLRVSWPDGTVGPWLQLAANQFAVIDRGSLQARIWGPGARARR